MAEEEVIILEEEEQKTPPPKKRNLLLIAIAAISFIIILLGATILYLLYKKKESPKKNDTQIEKIVKKIEKKEKIAPISSYKLENMVKKANYLYTHGKKREALKLYETISLYNESISNYNIGVALMKEKKYKEAIEAFKKAIEANENICVSYINSAVCALKLNKKKDFKLYLKKAKSYLSKETKSPLYSYYLSLINYYQNNYIESLVSLSHPTSSFYQDEQNYITSKIASFLNSNLLAIDSLEKIKNMDTKFALGLLYARIKEYDIALKHLQNALNNGYDRLKAKTAISLIYNKKGELESSGKLLKELYKKYEEKLDNIYPIEVKLKRSLFDVKKAQEDFKNSLFLDKEMIAGILFYFTPYKVFDVKESIKRIKKGSVSLYVDKIKPAISYLKTSSTISKVNLALSQGIKEAIDKNIYKANQIFKKYLKIYPKHSALHFNLALTYAQIGDYIKALKHFKRSYHLNAKNYLAGLYAAIIENILNKDNKMIISIIKEDITEDEEIDKSKKHFLFTLASLASNLSSSLLDWLEEESGKNPLYISLSVIISNKLKKYEKYKEEAKKLHEILPKDLIASLLYMDSKYRNEDIKSYAKDIQNEILKRDFNSGSFEGGYYIARILYTKMLQISGLLNHEKVRLENKIVQTQKSPIGLLQSIAYIYLYANDFEKSYTIYNELIDTFKQQDDKTLFFAAVASIAANHHSNAVALLELAKLTNPYNFESRYALGLLYQEIKNFQAASIQYNKIGDIGFQSKYFTFDIKN